MPTALPGSEAAPARSLYAQVIDLAPDWPKALYAKVEAALARQAAVALIGPRQVGKTTLALAIVATRPSLYLDLEATADRAKLADPVLFLGMHADKLVILDEIHRVPALFEALRGIIDAGQRAGNRTGRFLVLGSATIGLRALVQELARCATPG